ncbi:hypothetical protein [Paraburkholderia adhaesiva]|uniref:hypothetical protein n=1 Tax=Paraburkholderia adhaesiva TaxID=2883244 RepID=UPI001F3D6249|nr:hypothetical protein [Paraburkholderia adhaesiva]
MRALLSPFLIALPFVVAGCNTPPIPPGKPVDISTALRSVLEGLCDFKKDEAARGQGQGVTFDSITVEFDLTVDGSKNPPIAVAPDIQFIPTVSYGQILTANRGSRLTLTLKNSGKGSMPAECEGSKPVHQ